MAECFKCGVSGEKALLFEVISREGVVKVCRKCSFEENLPRIKKKTEGYFAAIKGQEKKESVYDRLSRMSGVDKREVRKSELLKKQETTLKEIIDKNFEAVKQETKKRTDLVNHFHWIIMRARRAKKLTQAQLAEEIAESEKAVKMAEQGIFPAGNELIKKLENYLRIRLVKEPEKYEKPKELKFDSEATKTLTISDLQEMKKKSKEKEFIFNEDVLIDEQADDKPEFVDAELENSEEEEFSSDEVDDLIFRRKND